ncbi:hypothetical protein DPMN_144016 [Dreissena polymorpha]|uniref:DUF6729 domain-containing protein n=1 Tax=Dreissena polymorpha TaxID=45954 RepID=A0A9D4JNS6_DREPO|nr:hypothetical protein DPMN_144016 [Dreissena polymorpha]
MASEYLQCTDCKRKVISWSHDILSQLDVGHRVQFPCILTAMLACDIQVILPLCNRGLGNSSSQIQKKLEEQHSEAHLKKQLHYLNDCKGFSGAMKSGLMRNHLQLHQFLSTDG